MNSINPLSKYLAGAELVKVEARVNALVRDVGYIIEIRECSTDEAIERVLKDCGFGPVVHAEIRRRAFEKFGTLKGSPAVYTGKDENGFACFSGVSL